MSPATHRQRGAVQNLANQLAQIATGWEISFDGPGLLAEPDVGAITIDVVAGSADVNGHSADLGMTRVLRKWTGQELARLGLDWAWLRRAQVTYRYRRSAAPVDETRSTVSEAWSPWVDHGLFDAETSVATEHGDAEGKSHNDQVLLRVPRLPDGGDHGGEISVKLS